MSEVDRQQTYSSMQTWAKALQRHADLAHLATAAAITKVECRDEFDSLQLPTYARYIMPLTDFYARAEAPRDEAMITPTLWFQLIPNTQYGERQTVLDVPDSELVAAIDARVTVDERNKYDILVSEFLQNKYGGQMIVDASGSVEIWFGEGNEMDYSSGEKPPTHTADNHTATGRFQYSFEDEQLREAVWQIAGAAAVPNDVDGRFGMSFHPGYYEFALCGEELRPIFLDYRSSPFYQTELTA